jgi:hypothetical protein
MGLDSDWFGEDCGTPQTIIEINRFNVLKDTLGAGELA